MAEEKTKLEQFFDNQASAALWDVAVSLKRGNALPLDADSVFQSMDKLNTYRNGGGPAYPGQIVAVVEETGTQICYLDKDLYVCPVGVIPTGDSKTIEVTTSGAISLLGATSAPNGTLPMIDAETGKLVWKTLEDIGAGDGNDNTTYEFAFADEKITITPKLNGQPIMDGEGEDATQVIYELDLSSFVTTTELDNVVGKAAEGEAAATGLYKVIADALAEAKQYADTNDANDNTEYHLEYDSENKEIKLVAGADTSKMTIDASPFIKDGMLHDVDYDADNKELVFTWNTDGGAKVDRVPVDGLIDVYTAGNGLDLTSNAFSVKVDATSETFLTVGADGVKLAGVQTAIDTAKQAAIDAAAADAATKAGTAKSEAIADAAGKYATKEALKATDDVAKDAQNRVDIVEGKIDEITSVGGEPNVIEKIKVNGVTLEVEKDAEGKSTKSVNIPVPTKVSQLENDSNLLTNITATNAGETYTSKLVITGTGTTRNIDDSALQEAIKLVDDKAKTAVQTVKIGNTAFTKEDGSTVATITKEALVSELGLGALAFQESIDTGVTSVSLASGSENGTLKLTVNGTETDNIAVKGLGDAAYHNASEFDANGAAAAVLGQSTDASTAATVYGVKALANSVLGTENDGATAKTVYGAHAAIAALTNGAVKSNTDAIILLNNTVDTEGSVKHTAKAAADAAVAALLADGGAVKVNTDAIAVLNGSDAGKSVRVIAGEEVAKVIDNAPEAYDTLKEIADWIANDKTGAAAMSAQIAANTTAIGVKAEGTTVATGLYKYTDDSIAALQASIHGVDDDTIKLNENKAYVAKVSTDILVQGTNELILSAGNATGYTTV